MSEKLGADIILQLPTYQYDSPDSEMATCHWQLATVALPCCIAAKCTVLFDYLPPAAYTPLSDPGGIY